MPKNRPVETQLPVMEESPKKKKKKKKTKEAPTEEEEEVALNTSTDSPKKKKKKKEECQVVPPFNGCQEEEEGKKKKRRKRRSTSQEEEEEEELSPQKKEEEDSSSPKKKKKKSEEEEDLSPKKKKKRKKEEEEEGVKEEEERDEEWSKEDTFDLLERVTRQLPPPEKDKRSCRVTLNKIDWDAACPPGRSSEVAQGHFMALIKKITIYKSLTQVVSEIHDLVESGMKDRRNRPSLPIHQFMKDFLTPQKKEEAKQKGENILKMGSTAWNRLPDSEKALYIDRYKKEIAKLQESDKEVKEEPEGPVKLPKLPHQIYWETTDRSIGAGKSRTMFMSLDTPQRIPYIRQSLEDFVRFEVDLGEYRLTDPDFTPPDSHVLTKGDLREYLDAYGCPPLPPTRAYVQYYHDLIQKGLMDHIPNSERLCHAMRLYKELSSDERARRKEVVVKKQQEYSDLLEKWLKGQDEVTRYAYDKWKEFIPLPNIPKPRKPQDPFPHKTPRVFSACPKFLNEPPRPPISAFRLFTARYRSSLDATLSGKALQQALRAGWQGLTDDQRALYQERIATLHRTYEENIRAFVDSLDERSRKVYLGFHRLPLYKFFQRDVFPSYPNSEEYPVFTKGARSPEGHGSAGGAGTEAKITSEVVDGLPHVWIHQDPLDEEEEEEVASPVKTKIKRGARPLLTIPKENLSLIKTEDEDEPTPPQPSPKKTKNRAKTDQREAGTSLEDSRPFQAGHKKTLSTGKTRQDPRPAEDVKKKKKKLAPSTVSTLTSPPHEPKGVGKGSKLPPKKNPHHVSEEEESDEDVAPAWLSPPVVKPKHAAPQQQSSSSGFSDTDSD